MVHSVDARQSLGITARHNCTSLTGWFAQNSLSLTTTTTTRAAATAATGMSIHKVLIQASTSMYLHSRQISDVTPELAYQVIWLQVTHRQTFTEKRTQ